MSTAMMFDRSMMMNPASTMGNSMPGQMPMGQMSMMPGMSGMAMVTRCKMKMEKCAGGMKITCVCDDEVMCGTLQNMCNMLCDSMCSCCCMMNGMMMCNCNMVMCKCECTNTADGVCVTCTSGDKACCDMLQACCDCMTACMKSGCMCCLCFGGMPVACGTCM